MQIRTTLLALLPITLAACDGTNPFDPEPVTTSAVFATPDAMGEFNAEIVDPLGGATIDASGEGFAYQVGSNVDQTGLIARAGLIPGATVTAPPAMGTATLSGPFEARSLLNGLVERGSVTSDPNFQSGQISLTADFDAGTLTGSTGGLSVDGAISGSSLTGTVQFNGITGNLTGLAGADQALGAFRGSSTDGVMAGGFNVTN